MFRLLSLYRLFIHRTSHIIVIEISVLLWTIGLLEYLINRTDVCGVQRLIFCSSCCNVCK